MQNDSLSRVTPSLLYLIPLLISLRGFLCAHVCLHRCASGPGNYNNGGWIGIHPPSPVPTRLDDSPSFPDIPSPVLAPAPPISPIHSHSSSSSSSSSSSWTAVAPIGGGGGVDAGTIAPTSRWMYSDSNAAPLAAVPSTSFHSEMEQATQRIWIAMDDKLNTIHHCEKQSHYDLTRGGSIRCSNRAVVKCDLCHAWICLDHGGKVGMLPPRTCRGNHVNLVTPESPTY